MAVDIANILVEAHKAVEAAKLPKEYQQVAFEKAVDMLTEGIRSSETRAPKSEAGGAQTARTALGSGSTDSTDRIAESLGLDRESAERIFHVEGDDLKLVIPSTKLSNAKKTATEEIALLVAAGRQAGGLDQETTDADKVRAIAEHYRKYDSPNFSRTIKDMHDVFIVRENGRKKLVKMTQPGWEAARELVGKLLGGE